MSTLVALTKRIPKRKPKDYPHDHEKYRWIGEAMSMHAIWRPVAGGYAKRANKGQSAVWARFKRLYPWAFSKEVQP